MFLIGPEMQSSVGKILDGLLCSTRGVLSKLKMVSYTGAALQLGGLHLLCEPNQPSLTQLHDRFRTAVPFWGQTARIINHLSPKRDCGPVRAITLTSNTEKISHTYSK